MKISKPEEDVDNASIEEKENIPYDIVSENGKLDNVEIGREHVKKKKVPHIGVVGKSGSASGGLGMGFVPENNVDGKIERPVHPAISKHKKYNLMQAMRRSLSEVSKIKLSVLQNLNI